MLHIGFQSSSQQNIPNRKENDIEQSIPKPIKMVVKDSGKIKKKIYSIL